MVGERAISRLVVALCVVVGCCGALEAKTMPLASVRSFMYQLQELDKPAAVEALARSDYDMLVVEPTFTCKGQESFDAKGMVARLHAGKPGRVVLAYVNVGEAESYRAYFQSSWKRPTKRKPGEPGFLVIADPDGWQGDYPVAFWDARWQEIVATGRSSIVKSVMAAGFDGVYLDWVEGYKQKEIVAAAKGAGVDPVRAMVEWIATIRKVVREADPEGLVVAQNAPLLIDQDPRYAGVIDGISCEDTWFGGEAEVKWGDSMSGDVPNDSDDEYATQNRLRVYAKYREARKVVFTVDYCVKRENARTVYEAAARSGLVALVTRTPLDRMTATPPPALAAGGARPRE